MKTTIRTLITTTGIFTLASGCHHTCFVAGTRVWTKKGLRPIEGIQVGDLVWSWNLALNEPVLREVNSLIRGKSSQTIRLRAGEFQILGVTSEHPFWNTTKAEWVKAEHVRVGDSVLCWPGADEARSLHVLEREVEERAFEVPVYTLSISGEETNYFAEGVLVHNKSPIEDGPCVTMEDLGGEQSFGDFGEVGLGQRGYLDVKLKANWCSQGPGQRERLIIEEDDPNMAFEILGDLNGVTYEFLQDLPHDQSHVMTVAFEPPEEGDFEVRLHVYFPSLEHGDYVRFHGWGVLAEDSQ